MEGLLTISLDLQMLLVAGYFAFKIATVGRGVRTPTEEFLLQVLVFGTVARGVSYAFSALTDLAALPRFLPFEGRVVAAGILTVLVAVLLGVGWRKRGNRLVSALMNATKTHVDDHEPSTWSSIMATPATWTFVHVHLNDGRIIESVFGNIPRTVPGGALTLNEDGLSLYVTRIHQKDGPPTDYAIGGLENDYVATYIPRSCVMQLDIGWR